ncbi:hypothetical protein WG907_03015 [Sphingobium sp. AN558]|uniref:hypothetical protein n=1 Tax=Sphingobium sp. AN558 TaxID=3133442 RepID=UPI0030C45F5A
MSDLAPESKESRAQEAAAIRRRWITLGEVLAVIAVLISAITLYLNWADRRDERTVEATRSREKSARAATLLLNAATASDDRLTLKPAGPDQIVQSQSIRFPTALGIAPVDTTGDPRIEGEWFSEALKKAREKAKLPDDSVGDERLPVAIATRFIVDGDAHEEVALYDVGYGITGRLLGGHHLTLRGLSRVSAIKAADAQAALDARWGKLTR